MYPALELYVLFPETVAVPTVVPLEHVVGALDCGPNTVNVTVPVALLVAPDSVEVIEPAAIAEPAVAVAGPEAVRVGFARATTVEVIPDPHVLAEDWLLLRSPL